MGQLAHEQAIIEYAPFPAAEVDCTNVKRVC
jgi:hypothetical protein